MQALVRAFGVLLMLTALAVTLTHAPDRSVDSLVTRWAPPPSDFMYVKGQFVHFRDEGPRNDPVPLVLIHGTASSLHTWQGWVGDLRARKRVITFDLPGFGLTGPFGGQYPRDDYRADNLARFTLDFLAALHVQRFAIGGNSLGGEVAWRVAAMAPSRVDRLILVDATGYAFVPEHVPVGFQLARVPGLNRIGEFLTPRSVVEDSVRDVYGDPSRVTGALVDRYFEMMTREGNRRALDLRMEVIASDLAPERIGTLKLPTLILWGAKDRLVPPVNAQRFHADIAASQLVIFPGLGHVPQEEDAQQSVAPVRAFLGLDSSSTAVPATAAASEPA
ncbi:MAG TPA: alpha/beta hydrolase [Burkholderiaceae bacterium]|jgi:pimeloyl-ACP methyl ester carboxylesterase|nr:alpha/beta hydrolase [Burkholderiaceae bacterium]